MGTYAEYHQRFESESGDMSGRLIIQRVQAEGRGFPLYDALVSVAASSEVVAAAGREVTVHVVPDEATAECCYDLGVLRWTEAPGYEAYLIPFGLDGDEALTLLEAVVAAEPAEWAEVVDGLAPPPERIVATVQGPEDLPVVDG